jgi:hypothetical protein
MVASIRPGCLGRYKRFNSASARLCSNENACTVTALPAPAALTAESRSPGTSTRRAWLGGALARLAKSIMALTATSPSSCMLALTAASTSPGCSNNAAGVEPQSARLANKRNAFAAASPPLATLLASMAARTRPGVCMSTGL